MTTTNDEPSKSISARRGGLGRGLSALIPQASAAHTPAQREIKSAPLDAPVSNMRLIPLKSISLNPSQPRKTFHKDELEELTASIREHGVLQPVMVRTKPGSKRTGVESFELVSGERRFRAASSAGLTEIPAVIREVDDKSSLALALIENIQREDLNIIETAEAYDELLGVHEMTQVDLARALGKSQPQIANAIRLLQLPVEVQNSLRSGQISEGHAKVILTVAGSQRQVMLWKEIVVDALSVRQSEKRAADLKRWAEQSSVAAPPRLKLTPDPQLEEISRKIGMHLGTKVRLNPGKGDKGVIEIAYYDKDQLEGIIEKLGA